MSSKIVKGSKLLTTGSSQYNILNFVITNTIKGLVNTAIPVIVKKVYETTAQNDCSYVDVAPLITQCDADGNKLDTPTLYKLPYSRIQGGVAAIVIDPCVNDIGLAVFAQQDSSDVKIGQSEAITPHSFRSYSLADGFYIGGFLNKKPEIYLELNQDNIATLHAPKKVVIESDEVTIESKNVEVTADKCVIKSGNVEIGEGAVESMLKAETFKTLFDTHTHLGNLGAPTGVPISPLSPTVLSTTVKNS